MVSQGADKRIKSADTRNCVETIYSRQQTMKTSPPKDMANYGWKSSLLLFYDAVATVDVLTASDNDDETCRNSGNWNCRFCITKIVVSF